MQEFFKETIGGMCTLQEEHMDQMHLPQHNSTLKMRPRGDLRYQGRTGVCELYYTSWLVSWDFYIDLQADVTIFFVEIILPAELSLMYYYV